ncbi:hypothetical protein FWD07_01295 [Candidatus Saccharibacteria bacterium]|nr:hypothetical protein [Candidatus Saccharibacteria bacterium]
MSSVIVPTITTDNPEIYKSEMEKIRKFSLRVQVDVADGVFAPVQLTPVERIWWNAGMEVDVHMMVARPSDYMDILLKLKPSMVILHAEVEEDITPLLELLKKSGIKSGIALLRPTFPGHLANAIHQANHVMIFSGELGKQGGKASLMQLEKVRMIKALNADVEIGWDGGIGMDNAFTIAQGGVDVLNVGAALSEATEPAEVYKAMMEEINKHGIF